MTNFSVFSLFLTANFLFSSFFVFAQETSFVVPSLTAPVVDQAEVLSDATEQKINTLLKKVFSAGGSQIQVLTIDSLNGLNIEEASIRVATSWALGTAKKDNGVLLLIAVADRQMRIEVGQGLEGDLTDAYSKRIISQIITPSFKAGEFNQGVLQGVLGILKYTDPEFKVEGLISDYDQSFYRQEPDKGKIPFWIRLLILAIFLFIIFNANTGSRGRGGFYGSGRGGGFGGGGGGWSGGGGGFSGGGASGRW